MSDFTPPSRPAVPRPGPAPYRSGGTQEDRPARTEGGSGHPAVDAAVQAVINAAGLPPADQIAQYEAAHRTLQETLATIDQA